MDRTPLVENQFLDFLDGYQPKPTTGSVDPSVTKEIFKHQFTSRLLDYEARRLKNINEGYYTIGSSGHEANAVFGHLLDQKDPCLLHYRSGAFMLSRAARFQYPSMVMDTLHAFCSSKLDPTSGGRHKVWGNKTLWVPPQTSTIASHLPKAVGMAFAIARANRMKVKTDVDPTSIVFVSFGDASLNHATAQTAFNAASWSAYQKLPTPVFFLCEDNGIGISVKTPQGWVANAMKSKKDIAYFYADGQNFEEVFAQAKLAIDYCRIRRKPVFFHLKTVRLFGHAGSDVETTYRSVAEIEEVEKMDPLISMSKYIMDRKLFSGSEIKKLYLEQKANIKTLSQKAITAKKLERADEVKAALVLSPTSVTLEKSKERNNHFEKLLGHLPENSPKPRHMAMLINWALHDLLLAQAQTVVFGEDVAKKGGVYHVTHQLQEGFGPSRVFNTLLDETMILGLSIGFSQIGFFPIPEIQYLAYYHNAQDQIRGEAASQSFFSDGQFTNPMVVRIASFAYQKGFGGHFHNDNSLAALLDVPGIMIVTPSRGDDAAKLLWQSVAIAQSQKRVVLFLEPIALYMQKDLYEAGDGQWLFPYPLQEDFETSIEPRLYFEGAKHGIIISYANGLHKSLQAAKILRDQHNLDFAVLDLRILKPLPNLQSYIKDAKCILIVDECREWGGVSDRIVSTLSQNPQNQGVRIQSLFAHDTYIPLGPAAQTVLVQVSDIVDKCLEMVE